MQNEGGAEFLQNHNFIISGSDIKLSNRIKDIYGSSYNQSILPVKIEKDSYKAYGYIGNLSIVSTQPTNISNEYDSIGQIQGESKIKPNTRFPQASMTMINEAIQNALDISGADLITDATFERNYTFMFLFEANYLVVTGEGWVKKKEGIKREKISGHTWIKFFFPKK